MEQRLTEIGLNSQRSAPARKIEKPQSTNHEIDRRPEDRIDHDPAARVIQLNENRVTLSVYIYMERAGSHERTVGLVWNYLMLNDLLEWIAECPSPGGTHDLLVTHPEPCACRQRGPPKALSNRDGGSLLRSDRRG